MATRFPPNWPSYMHNKCSVPACDFPNQPQVGAGSYDCQGVLGGWHCEGTYYVSPSMADSVIRSQAFRGRRRSNLRSKVLSILETGRPGPRQERLPQNVQWGSYNPHGTSRRPVVDNDKKLPGIPGLDQRKQQRPRYATGSPSTLATAPPPQPLNQPLYPYSVQQYYSHGNPVDSRPRPRNVPEAYERQPPRALVPQRRPRSSNQLSPNPHRRPAAQIRL